MAMAMHPYAPWTFCTINLNLLCDQPQPPACSAEDAVSIYRAHVYLPLRMWRGRGYCGCTRSYLN